MSEQKNVRFIRKNGKVIPIKENSKGGSQESKIVKHSKYQARSDHHSYAAKDKLKKSVKFGLGAGVATGLATGIKMRGRGGLVAGYLTGIAATGAGVMAGETLTKRSKKYKHHMSESKKYDKKASQMYRKIQNKDAIGDGYARRAYKEEIGRLGGKK
jgi:hypothetical protein